jgi:hypothetical protein
MTDTIIKPSAVQRYRERNRGRRYDYTASADVQEMIEHHRRAGDEKVWAGVIDGLIRMGHKAITGNKSSTS